MNDDQNDLGQPVGYPIPDWQVSPWPPQTPMVGRYCRLEPLNPAAHAQSLYDAHVKNGDDKYWTYLPYGPYQDFDEYQAWIADASASEDPQFFAVIDPKTDQAVGIASYLRIEPKIGSIEVGHIHFSPLLQRTPAATEAMFLMMQRAFDELGYRRYEWKCDALNAPSCKAAKRFGFTYEGVFRQHTMYKGRNRDTAWFSIIDTEWAELKQSYIKWLDVANFDENGEQVASLESMRS
ncbi:MAG: RimJ/RimL family protein N-acetyltransferase [Cellvibrionaceae bacterium]|jgi:RimJ/RimL family protein N-acetyltransferase